MNQGRNLGRQFSDVVYEVGDPHESDGYLSTRYGTEHMVHPSEFGVGTGEHFPGKYTDVGDVDVPLHRTRVVQDYVYAPHVRNLATVRPSDFYATQAYDPVVGYEQPDGAVHVTDGTHRLVAAHLRGDESIRLRLHRPQ